jgi:aldose 1-epimerase
VPDVTAVIMESFGRLDDAREVHRLVLTAGEHTVGLLTLGASLQSLTTPDRRGRPDDIVLGFPDPQSQIAQGRWFGATVGRVANRISGGRLTLDGHEYSLSANEGPNTLHGGADAFDLRLWEVAGTTTDDDGAEAALTLISPDGDQGFPCALRAEVTYRLTPDGRLIMTFTATNLDPEGGRATVVNLCNHAYFNLDGVGTGSVDRHVLTVPASRITEVDDQRLTTGRFLDVTGTPLDFRSPRLIGPAIREADPLVVAPHGLDHNWVIDEDAPRHPSQAMLRLGGAVHSPTTGRVLRIWTDRPGIQIFTANHLNGGTQGLRGLQYRQGDGLALETQLFPGATSFSHFPTARLAAGATVRSVTMLELTTEG